jgi:uncharacterized membrane protein YdjX (TVP38/TMEM64 family)
MRESYNRCVLCFHIARTTGHSGGASAAQRNARAERMDANDEKNAKQKKRFFFS